ncbi:transformation/transcription domain-associated protein-like isoform X2 [Paramacrobiotus metropolitanus]|uniref:transformation/transcription domain-associated protein-like isoform X2 n=1 Tax=Paramacrobiotus metropolitanus TaxID=2943436 RepID=UPI0024460849|nr:transformation/transcription domain-associated protein-like isoform X2 [Paramacrobiotus metropolitanus]
MEQDPSLGLPPALPIPSFDTSAPSHATIQWTEAHPLNKAWFLHVVAMADIKRDFKDRQAEADEAVDGFEAISGTFVTTQVVERIIHLNFKILSSLQPKFVQEDQQNALRRTIVRLVHRLALLEIARPLHNELLKQLIPLIAADNEEVGILCLKLILEIVKLARSSALQQAPTAIFSNPLLCSFIVDLLKRWAKLPVLVEKIKNLGNIEIPLTADNVVDINNLAEQLLCSVEITRSNRDEPNVNPNTIFVLPKATNSLRFLAESIFLIMYTQQNIRPKIVEMYPQFGQDIVTVLRVDFNAEEIEKYIQSLTESLDQARVLGAYHEFMLAYCKVPQLFAYVVRHFMPSTDQATIIGAGIVKLLTICPKEIIWGRRDVCGALKLIAQSDYRTGLIPYIPQLVDVDFLVGSASGSKDMLKAPAITIAMEALHYLRSNLSFATFEQVTDLCISYFSDRTLGLMLHMNVLRTVSTNLSESMVQKAREENKLEECRGVIMKIFSMLSLRLKVMVKYSLPVYKTKAKSALAQGSTVEPTELTDNASQNLHEQRGFLRAIFNAVKTFLWCVRECGAEGQPNIRAEDLKIFTRICKYGVQATELFVVGIPPHSKSNSSISARPSEKEFTEHVADAMKQFPLDIYRDIFQHIFWRFLELFKDDQLQQILSALLNCLLPYPGFSGITTTTMLDVAIPRFPELAEAGMEVSSSVLQIFKILFGAVSLYPKEVEQYFKPLVQKIFQQGFYLAMRARDPINLFLMFRAFFRAMGGGGHEVLYQDFLPNFPMILQVLCTFHSQRQKPNFRDIFNELCLIVPVRLSTLMPHISLLAPAILTAMQGAPQSVTQGLRTLELSIDNMQSDYLYEQLEPVKKDLMKALWNIMMTGSNQMQISALKFLGKICGHALKAIREPQPLHPKTMEDELGPCLTLQMPAVQPVQEPLQLPLYRLIEESYKILLEPTIDPTIRSAAWNIVQSFLLGIIRPDTNMQMLENLLHHPSFRHSEKRMLYVVHQNINLDTPYPKCVDEKNRFAVQMCLQGLMVACATKDFQPIAVPLKTKLVRHFCLMAIVQQHNFKSESKTDAGSPRNSHPGDAIDPYVMLDALIFVLGQEEPAISKTANAAIMLILETLNAVYEDLKNCVGLPYLGYLYEKLHSLCYDKSWCCKAGALSGLDKLVVYMPCTWTMEMSALLTRALMFVLRDSFQKMTYGIIDQAKKLLERILNTVLKPPGLDALPQEIQNLRQHALQEIIREFIPNTICVVDDVRKQAMDGLKFIAEALHKPLGDVLEPHKKLLIEFVPPKGISSLKSYQMAHQTALLEANEFFLTLSPPVVAYDLNKAEDYEIVREVLDFVICEDEKLQKSYPCFDPNQYYPVSFLPFRIAAFKFLTTFASVPSISAAVHLVLFNTLSQGSEELLDITTECLKKFASLSKSGLDVVTAHIASCSERLKNPASWNKDLTDRLSRLQTVYPQLFTDEFATMTYAALQPSLDIASEEQKETPHICDGVKKCALMITLLRRTAKEPEKYVSNLVDLVSTTEETLMSRNGRQLTNALSGYLTGYGAMVVDLFFAEDRILTPKWTEFFEKLLKGKDDFAAELKQQLTSGKLAYIVRLITFGDDYEANWRRLSVGVRILYLLTKRDPQWLIANQEIIGLLRSVWNNPSYHAKLRNTANQHHDTWELSVKFLVLLMLNVRMHGEDFDALFEMTRHSSRSIAEGSRWRQFVECHIVLSLSPKHRREMFLKWLELVKQRKYSDEYLSEICDLIIQPVLKQQFMQPTADQMINDTSKTATAGAAQGNLISITVDALLNMEFLLKLSDILRVSILKLFALFTEQGENYFPEPKVEKDKLLARFCLVACGLLQKREQEHIQIDVGTIFQSQNLLAQISIRYTIPQSFYMTILRSLFTGGMMERGSNKSAIDILLPNMISRTTDGAMLCCRFLRRYVTDDMSNLSNNSVIFSAIVRHHLALYNYRGHFIGIMVQNSQKFGLVTTTQIELKRTAVEMLECIVHWEAIRKGVDVDGADGEGLFGGTHKNVPKRRPSMVPLPKDDKPLDQKMADSIANILLRLSFMFGETNPMESFGRKCIRILKFFMKKEMYSTADVKLQWLDKVLNPDQAAKHNTADQGGQAASSNVSGICLALETLTYFVPILMRSHCLNVIHDLSPSLQKVMHQYNARIAKCMNQLVSKLCETWPGDPSQRNLPSQLESLYSHIIKTIHEGLGEYEKTTPGHPIHIFCTLMLLKATMQHVPSILERFLTMIVNCAKKITDEHLGIKSSGQQAQTQDGLASGELVVIVLDIIKVPKFFDSTSGNSHRQSIVQIMNDLISRGTDVRVHRALIQIFDDWLTAVEKQPEPISLSAMKAAPVLPVPVPTKKTKKKKNEERSESEPSSVDVKKKKKKNMKDVVNEPIMPPALPPPPEDVQTLSHKDLSALILKLQVQLERKFPDEIDLQTKYTNLIYKIALSDDKRILDLQQRLFNSYMYGLRHPDPEWRKKFYTIYNNDYPKHLYDRLTCLFNGFNWDMCSYTYYIGFCINSILDVANNIDSGVTIANGKTIQSVTASVPDASALQTGTANQRDKANLNESFSESCSDNGTVDSLMDETPKMKSLSVGVLVEKVYKLNEMTKAASARTLLEGVYQLCNSRNQLAHDVWTALMPQIWKILTGEQKEEIVGAFKAYLMQHTHQAQRDLAHFPIQAMFDAMSKCEGAQFKLHPVAVMFLGERQNLWYRSVFLLEEMAIPAPVLVPNQKGGNKALQQSPSDNDPAAAMNQLARGALWMTDESLARMYSALGEDDFMAAVWQLRGLITPKSDPQVPRPMPDFRSGLGFERQGMYYDAKESYDKAIDTFLVEYRDKSAPDTHFGELQILTERYAEILRQLNMWPALYHTAVSEALNNPSMALEAAWHQDLFDVVPALLQSAGKQCPPREELNFGFCKAYNAMHKVLKEGLNSPPSAYKDEGVDKLIDVLQQMCIKMWRHLPKTGTMAHRPLIEMACRVGDLKELLGILPALHSAQQCNLHHVGSLRNMVKNWKVRVPSSGDDLRFWGEITDLRSQILTHVINLSTEVSHACNNLDITNNLTAFPIMSIHTISQNLFNFSKAARLQQLPRFAVEILSRVQTLPVVPLVDCFERVRNHVMACLDLFSQTGNRDDLFSALEAIEGVTTSYFTKEMNSELGSLRGQVAMKLLRPEDGQRLLSSAVQLSENCWDGWLKFGDYYEELFYKNPADLSNAKRAVVAYIFGSRSHTEATARECCAKLLALLNHDDASGTISAAIDEAGNIIPPSTLVFWVPQLIHLMMRDETAQASFNLLTHVAKGHPQPVFLHVRTYFRLMKVVELSKDSTAPMGVSSSTAPTPVEVKQLNKRRRNQRDLPPLPLEEKIDLDAAHVADGAMVRASSFVMNCVNIVRIISETHPVLCNALENFTTQIMGITMAADRWHEDLLAHLIQALKKCYALEFENRDKVMQAKMTPSMIQCMNTIVRSFGTGVYQEPGGAAGSVPKTLGDVTSEAIQRRAQALQTSSEYNKLRKDFVKDFDCTEAENLKLQTMISKLKKWIRTFEKVIKSHPGYTYLDMHHRQLINFTNFTAEMELPGDFTIQRNPHINRVMQILPRMDVVFKHNIICRRIYFVNNVGETIPYLIIADNANTLQGRKEERILQMFSAVNPIFEEFPESNKRTLKYYVPKVTPIAPAIRLMEDSQNSVCIWDVYKKYCDKKNIDSDGPIMKFYERIVAVMHRNNQTLTNATLRDCLKETQIAMVQPRVLRDYFWKLYPNADEYFLFRRTFIRSHAILSMAEHLLRLTKLVPDMMHIHIESGVEGVYSYTFEMDDRTGERLIQRTVPFRLTPNLTEIFTVYGVQGPFHHSMVAAARALKLSEAKFKAYVKTIFSDEVTYWMIFRKEMSNSLAFADSQTTDKGDPLPPTPSSSAPKSLLEKQLSEPDMQSLVQRGVSQVLGDLNELVQFQGHESHALKLINIAKSPDNLCRMDPSWHPWL